MVPVKVDLKDLGLEITTVPLLASYRTNRATAKVWVTPQNSFVPLGCWHWEYFRDPPISARYGVGFEAEQPTRLAALRVGFVRVNYEVNGGRLTIESMRWDQGARQTAEALISANRDSIDNLVVRVLSDDGTVINSLTQTFVEVKGIEGVRLPGLLGGLTSKEVM